MKNILFITSELPYPLITGSKIKVFNLIKNLSSKYKIFLLSFIKNEEENKNIPFLLNYCVKVETVLTDEKFGFFERLQNFFSLIPVVIRKHILDSAKKKILLFIKKYQFFLIHFDGIYVSYYIKFIKDIPTILHEHNIEYDRYLHQIKIKKVFFLRKLRLLLDYLKYKRYELKICSYFTKVLVVSEEDKKKLKNSKIKIELFSNGVDCDYFKPMNVEIEPYSLVFTGTMSYYPNIDAIEYFCNEIFPKVKQVFPQVKLYIVGLNPPLNIQKLSNLNIIVTGKVKDVRPYIAKAHICIVPIRIGGGTRGKILEFWAMEKIIISTSIGAEGLEFKNGENIIIADTKKEFAEQIIKIFKKEKINKLEENRNLVLKKYDFKYLTSNLIKIYETIY